MLNTLAHRPSWLALALASLTLAGCGSSSSSSDTDNEHAVDDSLSELPGRLLVTAAQQPMALVYDLDSQTVMTTMTLDHIASSAYTSPQGRYALLSQRQQDQIQLVDGGLYQEDHGDHLHPYAKAPQLLSHALTGSRPTHVTGHQGYGTVFFDGSSDSSINASVQLFSDAQLASNEALSLTLDSAMHGTAEVVDGHLLVTWRSPEAESSLPEQVELYRIHGDHFDFETRFDQPCPGLHGSLATEHGVVFGCSDGVLLVHQHDGEFEAHKIASPDAMADARIGSFYGGDENHLIIARAGNQLWLLDLEQQSLSPLEWQGSDTIEWLGMHSTEEGEHLLGLDNNGVLHRFDATKQYAHGGSVTVLDGVPSLDDHASIAISSHADMAYIADQTGSAIKVVNLASLGVSTISLPFAPAAIAWMGLMEEHEHDDHDHSGHDHDDDHSDHDHDEDEHQG